MSVIITGRIFWSDYDDISYINKSKKQVKVAPSTAKIVMLAIGDSADDFGENSYQSFATIAKKSSLSDRRSAIRVVRALLDKGYIFIKGVSTYGTNNFSINLEKLGTPPQKRAKTGRPKNEETSDLESPLLETSDSRPESGDSEPESSDLKSPDPSLTRPKTITAPNEKKGMINPNSKNRTDAKVQGDVLDGYLWGKSIAENMNAMLEDCINDYPPDCQSTLRTLIAQFNWQVSSIPDSSSKSRFAQWIKEIREVNSQVGAFGQQGVIAACKASKDLTVSHPAGINWAIAGEVGKLAKRTQQTPSTTEVITAFTESRNLPPLSGESKELLKQTKERLKEKVSE